LGTSIASTPLLSVRDVTIRFGGIVALDTVSFDVPAGSVYGLIGPNGAGKTTLFNCLSRLYGYQSGDILFKGASVTACSSHDIARLGIGRTFQNLAMFATLSVEQNIMVGAHCRSAAGFVATCIRTPAVRREEDRLRRRAGEIVDYLGLGAVRHTAVAQLPFGVQKRVELGRALASEPTLLLLDEPAAGLGHEELAGLGALIRDIRDRLNITVLLVEHHMNLVMSTCDRLAVLNFGRRIAEGTAEEVQAHPEVIAAYLGAAAHAA
jgi:branched-chain amino acid transport system ATP-binding protein